MTTFQQAPITSKIIRNMDEEKLKYLFGKRVRNIRKSRKLTQEQLAELIGMDTHHLCKMENGSHFPKIKNLAKMVEVLNINIKELFTFEEHKTEDEQIKDNIIINLQKLNAKELSIVSSFIDSIIELRN